MKLTEHFTLEEMIITQHRGIDNIPPAPVIENLKRTAARMENVRTLLKVHIIISSGYRCPELNAAIGGSQNSRHMLGLAADFIAPDFGIPAVICNAIKNSDINYDQLIFEHTWVHFGLALDDRVSRKQVLTLMPGGIYAHGIIERTV